MDLKRKVIVSTVISMAVFITSFLTTLIPCQLSPSVPNPDFAWQLCTFNPDLKPSSQIIVHYFGLTNSLMDAYLILLIGLFCISFILFSLIDKRKRR
jgi:hypothetical protein